MARTTVEKQIDKITFPAESLLDLKIVEAVVSEQSRKDSSETWEKINIKFQILGVQAVGGGGNPSDFDNWIADEEGRPGYIYGSTSFRLTTSPQNKLRIWCEAIFNMELGEGFELDSNMLIGRYCRGLTSQYQKKVGNDTYDRHQIDTLLPARQQQPQQVQQQAPPQQWDQQAPQQTFAQQQHQAYAQPPSQGVGQDPWAPAPAQQQQQQAPPPQQPQAPPPAQDPWGGGWGDDPTEPGF